MTQLLAALAACALIVFAILGQRYPRPFLLGYRFILGVLLLTIPLLALGAVFLPQLSVPAQEWAARSLPLGALAVPADAEYPAMVIALAAGVMALMLPAFLLLDAASMWDRPATPPASSVDDAGLAQPSEPGNGRPIAAAPVPPARDIRAAAETMASATSSRQKSQRVADYLS